MRIIILGGNGYLGWPTAVHLTEQGHAVMIVDSHIKREWINQVGVAPLKPYRLMRSRIEEYGGGIESRVMDIFHPDFTNHVRAWAPDVIIHYAEQPSAPFSMATPETCMHTARNNVLGTLKVLWAIKDTDIHLVKLGTMGEYGTPNIDIEEGWLDVEHNGRKDRMLYPKKPGSWYHASKVCDSVNIEMACRTWGLRATDLNQGIVYGTYDGKTSFHYDAIFGTCLNRFIAQAAVGENLTVYGSGKQTRAWLSIYDTLACVELACLNPAEPGEFRVFNQFTETFSVAELAQRVANLTSAHIEHIPNPRVEEEDHHYHAAHTGLVSLGLKPHLLTDSVLADMLAYVGRFAVDIDRSQLRPKVTWR